MEIGAQESKQETRKIPPSYDMAKTRTVNKQCSSDTPASNDCLVCTEKQCIKMPLLQALCDWENQYRQTDRHMDIHKM